jgi:pimeloyl-ACP methyl ester carboxylesterase
VIALDMRGHGESDAPADVDDYSVLHTVGDVIGVMDALGIHRVVLVGHDAGTTTAYHAALMLPDRVRGVVGLSVPYIPRGPVSLIEGLRQAAPPGFYMHYFQTPGVAELELDADVRESITRLFLANSGENPDGPIMMIVPEGGTLLGTLPSAEAMGFADSAAIQKYVDAYSRTGFRGGLNGYRVFQRNWELTAPWHGMALPVPACFVGGTKDTVLYFPGFKDAALATGDALLLEGAGHWIQAERASDVNARLLTFMENVPP